MGDKEGECSKERNQTQRNTTQTMTTAMCDQQEGVARALFEAENNIAPCDEIFSYSKEQHLQLFETKPWTQEFVFSFLLLFTQNQNQQKKKSPKFFKKVKVSAVALVKMASHAQSGGNIEVMGILQVCLPVKTAKKKKKKSLIVVLMLIVALNHCTSFKTARTTRARSRGIRSSFSIPLR